MQSKTLFCSDSHISHVNSIPYCNRPFKDIVEMNDEIVRRWNSVVSPEDTVYHLGDVAFGSVKTAEEVLFRLNGKIVLVAGNHDRRLKKTDALRARFEIIVDYYELKVPEERENIVLSHFPFAVWNSSHHGALHFHGHCHSTPDRAPTGTSLRCDVGMDNFDFTPRTLAEIRERMREYPEYVNFDYHDEDTNR